MPADYQPPKPERLATAENTLTKGWEAWETESHLSQDAAGTQLVDQKKMGEDKFRESDRWRDFEIRMNPVLTKDEVLPEHDEVLQMIKERYLGLDDEHARRWRNKYKYLELPNLQEVY